MASYLDKLAFNVQVIRKSCPGLAPRGDFWMSSLPSPGSASKEYEMVLEFNVRHGLEGGEEPIG